ncbi:MAG: PIN domain-containing protein [Aquabacterium sp.]|nr:PIN domain-containing protein [Aquabacterium sp.]
MPATTTPDVNVLVSAFHAGHPHHTVARAWLDAALAACQSGGRLQLLPMVCTSFVRIVTHARVFAQPAGPLQATGFIDALLRVPGCEWLGLGSEWPAFAQLCNAAGLKGNAVQDAWIAMAARRHGSHLVTFDKDFAALLDRHEYTLLVPRA